jgi:TRAP-type mannitol/chloroaromatic compound transport system permease small subunit
VPLRALTAVAGLIDRLNEYVGRAVAWLTVLMVIDVFVVVVLRYVFSSGWIWMQETYVWMHGMVFTLGAGYTLLHDGHVRIDIIYRTAGVKYKALINLLGSLFLGLPVLWLLYSRSIPYVTRSWKGMETSAEAGGLPYLFILKTVIPVFCILFGLQLIALVLRSLCTLVGGEQAGRKA